MTRRIRRVIAVAGIGGEIASLEELLGGLPEAGDDAVAVVGDLGSLEQGGYLPVDLPRARAGQRADLFGASDHLRESSNMEIAYLDRGR